MNAANERINIINVIILEYRVRIDPTLLHYYTKRLLVLVSRLLGAQAGRDKYGTKNRRS